jgi:hypothetical protein
MIDEGSYSYYQLKVLINLRRAIRHHIAAAVAVVREYYQLQDITLSVH